MLKDTIKAIRKKNHMSQLAFANRVGVSQGAVFQWEQGMTNPSTDKLAFIAKEFGVSMDQLMGGELAEADVEVLRRPVRDEDLMFSLFGQDDKVTSADLEEVKRYAEFLKMRKHSGSV